MKKCCFIVAFCMLLMSLLLPVDAAADNELILTTHYEDPVLNAIANVQRVSGEEYKAVLTGDNAPGIAYAKVAELADTTAFVRSCLDNKAIPTLFAANLKEAQKVIEAVEALSCKDLTAISNDPAVLKYIRNKKVVVRTGLMLTLETDKLTSEEAHNIRTMVRSAPATFCVVEEAVASRQLVFELQELAVAVWVEAGESDASVLAALTSGANGVISSSAYNTAAIMNTYFEDHTMTRTPVMIGHRGNPTQAPENSLSGFLTAYENGADVFEIDVEITKDDEIIIMHDSSLNRTTNYTDGDTVGNMTLEEIKQYRLIGLDGKVTDETVPTLREVLEAFQDKDCRIFIEFKGYNQDNVPKSLEIVKEFGMEDRVDVISFNSNFLTQTQKEIEGMSTGYLQSPSGAVMNELVSLTTLYSSVIGTQSANSSINPNKGVMSKYYLQAATDRGFTVWPWTYSKSTANMAFLLCPDGVTTDDVQWSKDMLKYIETDRTVEAKKGKAVPLSVLGTTYGRTTAQIPASELLVKVISGEDVVSVDNGVITAVQNGTAQVMFGYVTETTGGSPYVLYTQPVTVEVASFTPMMLALVIAGAVILLGAVVVTVLLKKK